MEVTFFIPWMFLFNHLSLKYSLPVLLGGFLEKEEPQKRRLVSLAKCFGVVYGCELLREVRVYQSSEKKREITVFWKIVGWQSNTRKRDWENSIFHHPEIIRLMKTLDYEMWKFARLSEEGKAPDQKEVIEGYWDFIERQLNGGELHEMVEERVQRVTNQCIRLIQNCARDEKIEEIVNQAFAQEFTNVLLEERGEFRKYAQFKMNCVSIPILKTYARLCLKGRACVIKESLWESTEEKKYRELIWRFKYQSRPGVEGMLIHQAVSAYPLLNALQTKFCPV